MGLVDSPCFSSPTRPANFRSRTDRHSDRHCWPLTRGIGSNPCIGSGPDFAFGLVFLVPYDFHMVRLGLVILVVGVLSFSILVFCGSVHFSGSTPKLLRPTRASTNHLEPVEKQHEWVNPSEAVKLIGKIACQNDTSIRV